MTENKILPGMFYSACIILGTYVQSIDKEYGFKSRYVAVGHMTQQLGELGGGELNALCLGKFAEEMMEQWRIANRFINQFTEPSLIDRLVYYLGRHLYAQDEYRFYPVGIGLTVLMRIIDEEKKYKGGEMQ